MVVKYIIRWERFEFPYEPLECRGLTAERLARRLCAVTKLNGPVIISSVEVEDERSSGR